MSNGELLDLSTKRESAPSKRWRNRWRASTTGSVNRTTGQWIPRTPGEVFDSITVWPSKEIAEQRALESVARTIANDVRPNTYLGAFPCEGESPP